MKFVFYCYSVSLMPGGAWRYFWQQFNKIWRLGDIFGDNLARFCDLATFLAKNECSRNLKSRACNVNNKRDFSNLPDHWRNWEFCTPSLTINSPTLLQLIHSDFDWLPVRLRDYALVWSATCDNISVFGFMWNLLYYAECGQRHCRSPQLRVLVYSGNFFC